MKTASGVQNFLTKWGYEATFNQLYALLKTRDSCNPDKALEPSAPVGNDNQEGKQKQFVPVRNRKRKHKGDALSEAVDLVRGVVENDPMHELVTLIRDDMEKSHQHGMRLMQLLLESGNQQQSVGRQVPPPFTQHNIDGNHAMYQGYHGHQGFPEFQFRPVSPAAMSLISSETPSWSSRYSPSTDSDNPVYQPLWTEGPFHIALLSFWVQLGRAVLSLTNKTAVAYIFYVSKWYLYPVDIFIAWNHNI